MKKYLPFAPAVAWGIFIFILSTLPGKDLPKFDWGDLFSVDKLVHLIFYATLTWLILFGKQRLERQNAENHALGRHGAEGSVSVKFIVGVAVFSAAYGWFLEFYQEYFCQDRLFEILDGVANTMGAALAAAFFFWQQWRRRVKF